MPSLDELVAPVGAAPLIGQTMAPENNYGAQLFAGARWSPVGPSPDLDRILALPRRPPVVRGTARAEALCDDETARYSKNVPIGQCACAQIDEQVRLGRRTCLVRMLPEQALAMREIRLYGGLLAALPVGVGKTFLDILAPLALVQHGIQRALLLVPASLMTQLKKDYALIAQHFRVPSIAFHDNTNDYVAVPGEPVLDVLSYSRLQTKKYTAWIKERAPQVIIADECDALADTDTSRTSRVIRQYQLAPETRFLCWTGSITDDSIENYWHLAAFALRELSPLPHDVETVRDWGRAIDPSDAPAPPGHLLRFCQPGETVWSGFNRRLAETPGVVIGTAQSTTAELVITRREAPPLPPKIVEALDKVRSWVRPDSMAGPTWVGNRLVEIEDDADLEDALAVAKCATEVACGLFYRWVFPRGEHVDLIKAWLKARKDYHKEQRYKLLHDRQDHLDSPLLAQEAADRAWGFAPQIYGMPNWRADSWPAWRTIRNQVKPETQAVWLDEYLARDAAEWALENDGQDRSGIVWYSIVEFGKKIAELSRRPMYGGGKKSIAKLAAETGERSVVLSIDSHGRGRNGLQYLFDRQLLTQVPSSNKMTEQVLGRLARQGARAGTIYTWFYDHTDELRRGLDQAMLRAEYVRGTLGVDQKILIGFKNRD